MTWHQKLGAWWRLACKLVTKPQIFDCTPKATGEPESRLFYPYWSVCNGATHSLFSNTSSSQKYSFILQWVKDLNQIITSHWNYILDLGRCVSSALQNLKVMLLLTEYVSFWPSNKLSAWLNKTNHIFSLPRMTEFSRLSGPFSSHYSIPYYLTVNFTNFYHNQHINHAHDHTNHCVLSYSILILNRHFMFS